MTNPNFASILDESPTEVNIPQPIPQGTYLCVVQGPWREDKSTKKGTDFVEFILKPIEPMDDVDIDELGIVGGLDDKTLKLTFWETKDSIYRLDEFHVHCGVDLDDGQSRRMRNDDVINAEVLAYVTHEPSQDGKRIFANVQRTAPAE